MRQRRGRQHGVELRAVLLETGERIAVKHAAARQLDPHRIDEAAIDDDFEMDVRAGRQSGRADEADDLALAHAAADLEPARERGHVAIGGLITVVVAKANVFAVAALEPDLLDLAVAGGKDRRAERRTPVDAGVHFADVQHGMRAPAERRSLDAGRHRLAHQELLVAHTVFIIVVVDSVVGSLEAIVLLGLAADAERGVAHDVGAFAVFVGRVQHVETVAGLHFALEIDVVGVDADQVVDHRLRHVVAQRRLPQALIEAHAATVFVFLVGLIVAAVGDLGVDIANVDRDIAAEIGERDRRRDAGIAGDDDAQRLHMAEAGGGHQDAQLFTLLDAALERSRPDHGDDAFDLIWSGAEFAQDRADRLALFDDDLAFAPIAAAVELVGRFRQQRDVFGYDPRLEAEIIVAVVFRRVAHFQAWRPAGTGDEALCHSDTRGGFAHAGENVVERQQRLDLREQRIEVAHGRRHRLYGPGGRHQIAGDERNLGVRFGSRRLVVAGDGIGQQLLRIERWDVGG